MVVRPTSRFVLRSDFDAPLVSATGRAGRHHTILTRPRLYTNTVQVVVVVVGGVKRSSAVRVKNITTGNDKNHGRWLGRRFFFKFFYVCKTHALGTNTRHWAKHTDCALPVCFFVDFDKSRRKMFFGT